MHRSAPFQPTSWDNGASADAFAGWGPAGQHRVSNASDGWAAAKGGSHDAWHASSQDSWDDMQRWNSSGTSQAQQALWDMAQQMGQQWFAQGQMMSPQQAQAAQWPSKDTWSMDSLDSMDAWDSAAAQWGEQWAGPQHGSESQHASEGEDWLQQATEWFTQQVTRWSDEGDGDYGDEQDVAGEDEPADGERTDWWEKALPARHTRAWYTLVRWARKVQRLREGKKYKSRREKKQATEDKRQAQAERKEKIERGELLEDEDDEDDTPESGKKAIGAWLSQAAKSYELNEPEETPEQKKAKFFYKSLDQFDIDGIFELWRSTASPQLSKKANLYAESKKMDIYDTLLDTWKEAAMKRYLDMRLKVNDEWVVKLHKKFPLPRNDEDNEHIVDFVQQYNDSCPQRTCWRMFIKKKFGCGILRDLFKRHDIQRRVVQLCRKNYEAKQQIMTSIAQEKKDKLEAEFANQKQILLDDAKAYALITDAIQQTVLFGKILDKMVLEDGPLKQLDDMERHDLRTILFAADLTRAQRAALKRSFDKIAPGEADGELDTAG
eukprot:TRINITY_DN649_c0_g1_i1.p1 TRINITY_DN649_c0_g1~~TRINITY_DN649_c0_g1_i1.p1  ORF type:complete len:549 (+),score=147.94 TRINITY_DN649_c0_g1_i1:84-1730(+)